jgi:NodT family efflux transporter outer membrane factor (OMF) lipoprotein
MRTAAAALLTLAITGCTVGPNFESPEATAPAQWAGPTSQPAEGDAPPTTGPSVATTQPIDLSAWWKQFNDPLLDSLIDRALAQNLDLQLIEARLRQVRAARGVTAADLYPRVDAGGGYTRSGGGQNSGAAADEHDLYRAGFDASWEIDIFGGVRRSVEAADADIAAAFEDRRDVLVTMTAEVAINYINLRALQRQIAIAQDNLQSQLRSAQLTRAKQAGGLVSGLDVANSDALVASTRSQIPALQAAERQAIYALSVLVGAQPDALLPQLSQPEPLPGIPLSVPIGLPSDLLRRRPDVRRAEAQLHAATARVGVATADLFPRFSLTGSFGLSGDRPSSLTNIANHSWSIGPAISWPVFDAGRIRSNILAQQAVQDQAFISYKQSVLLAFQDVENALISYDREQARREELIKAVDANTRAVRISNELYSVGSTDFLNVLSAQRSLYSSQDALEQSNRNIVTNLITLYKALGGGW